MSTSHYADYQGSGRIRIFALMPFWSQDITVDLGRSIWLGQYMSTKTLGRATSPNKLGWKAY